MELSVVLPTFNEEETVATALEGLRNALQGIDYEIIIVDDSTDATPEIVESASWARVKLFHRKGGSGLGSAYKFGIPKAKGDVIVTMDADGSHDPARIPGMLEAIEDCDVVVGSRYVEGGRRRDRVHRRIFPKIASLVYCALGSPVHDMTSGYRAYKKEVLENIGLSSMPDDFSFQVAVLLALADAGAEIKEVPIVFSERVEGESKYGITDLLGNIKVLLRHIF